MKKILHQKVSRSSIIIAGAMVIMLLVAVAYFVATKYWINSITAEDYCSAFGLQESRAGRPFGPEGISRCMDNYKQNHHD